jgi:hypothetical protein
VAEVADTGENDGLFFCRSCSEFCFSAGSMVGGVTDLGGLEVRGTLDPFYGVADSLDRVDEGADVAAGQQVCGQ